MACRRCKVCKHAWPSPIEYQRCPYCDGPTTYEQQTTSMSIEEAERRCTELRVAAGEFDTDWATAEQVAATSGLDVADLLVAKRKPAA